MKTKTSTITKDLKEVKEILKKLEEKELGRKLLTSEYGTSAKRACSHSDILVNSESD
ncbi:MAG: hypothetical protein LBE12_01175 [Planctomycetaceae bacterium]|jgi:hypothetical protein|nr:hypothetical protein [Planctomycetaceae bacterium]